MKAALETAARLLGALEDFVSREGVLLRAGDYSAAAAVQQRVNPLIAELCALGAASPIGLLGPRIEALLARRREFLSGLASRREVLGRERQRLAGMRERLKRVRPYFRAAVTGNRTKRLNAAV